MSDAIWPIQPRMRRSETGRKIDPDHFPAA
jgi:hypothetical protein